MNFNPFSSKEISALVNFRSERLQITVLLCASKLSLVLVGTLSTVLFSSLNSEEVESVYGQLT